MYISIKYDTKKNKFRDRFSKPIPLCLNVMGTQLRLLLILKTSL